MRIILSLFDNAKGIFGIEDNKPDCIAKLTELTKNEPRMEVKALKTKYPQGSERQLIFATTGRAINSTMLPADAGCIVDNVDTIVAIYHAVKLGRPLMHRIVTITGDAITDPKNFYVCLLYTSKYPAMMPNEVKLQLYRSADHSGIDESFKCWGCLLYTSRCV